MKAYRIQSNGCGGKNGSGLTDLNESTELTDVQLNQLPGAPYKISIWHNANSNTGSGVAVATEEEAVSTPTATPTKKGKKSPKTKTNSKTTSNPNPTTTSNCVRDIVLVTSYETPGLGPYPEDIPPMNRVRFTPTQIEAIRSGMNKVCIDVYYMYLGVYMYLLGVI